MQFYILEHNGLFLQLDSSGEQLIYNWISKERIHLSTLFLQGPKLYNVYNALRLESEGEFYLIELLARDSGNLTEEYNFNNKILITEDIETYFKLSNNWFDYV